MRRSPVHAGEAEIEVAERADDGDVAEPERRGLERRLGTSSTPMSNRFVWYGTTRRFETLSQTFVTDEAGAFNAHHYRYAPGMSTFIRARSG